MGHMEYGQGHANDRMDIVLTPPTQHTTFQHILAIDVLVCTYVKGFLGHKHMGWDMKLKCFGQNNSTYGMDSRSCNQAIQVISC